MNRKELEKASDLLMLGRKIYRRGAKSEDLKRLQDYARHVSFLAGFSLGHLEKQTAIFEDITKFQQELESLQKSANELKKLVAERIRPKYRYLQEPIDDMVQFFDENKHLDNFYWYEGSDSE
jgi:hypothetical protein